MQTDPLNPKRVLEPYEEVHIDTDMLYLPLIIEKINGRKGVLLNAED